MADELLSMVISQHRLPECILSDHGPDFSIFFWDELMSLLDITPTFRMALHQTNRIAEVTNRTNGTAIMSIYRIEELGGEISFS